MTSCCELFVSVVLQKQSGFRVDSETCTFGTVVKGQYKMKSNFTIELVTFVDAGEFTGYFSKIVRRSDKRTK